MSPKCPMIQKSYPPGQKNKRRSAPLSEYGKELREKQKLKKWYNLGEKQFRNYAKEILRKRGRVENTAEALIRRLESRLDNVVFRLGFAKSRSQARQMVSHGHFLVNGKTVNIPSRQLKKGDKVSLHPSSQKNKIFSELKASLKKYQAPSWLRLDADKMEGEVIGAPTVEEASPPAEISAIFEFYSR